MASAENMKSQTPARYNHVRSACIVVAVAIVFGALHNETGGIASVAPFLAWSIAQWTLIPSVASKLQQFAWDSWEGEEHDLIGRTLEIQRISIQDHADPVKYLESTYGKNWRNKPLLLQGIWNSTALEDPSRRLSLHGLLKENLTIPYFRDARVYGSLSPDDNAPVREIVQRIANGHPHKIGTQFLVQTFPELMDEVAPINLLTDLFGSHFTKSSLLGHGNTLGIFPGTTTVPVFVANGAGPKSSSEDNQDGINLSTSSPNGERPITGLHCEPIGNVAVQLSGVKEWTLIDPEHFHRLKPAIAADGRAFFASWATSLDRVPRYQVQTVAGDAIWVPTWTWHRVDYIESDNISIGGSLFHFRPYDFVTRNPLYAWLVIPAMIKELAGIATQ